MLCTRTCRLALVVAAVAGALAACSSGVPGKATTPAGASSTRTGAVSPGQAIPSAGTTQSFTAADVKACETAYQSVSPWNHDIASASGMSQAAAIYTTAAGQAQSAGLKTDLLATWHALHAGDQGAANTTYYQVAADCEGLYTPWRQVAGN